MVINFKSNFSPVRSKSLGSYLDFIIKLKLKLNWPISSSWIKLSPERCFCSIRSFYIKDISIPSVSISIIQVKTIFEVECLRTIETYIPKDSIWSEVMVGLEILYHCSMAIFNCESDISWNTELSNYYLSEFALFNRDLYIFSRSSYIKGWAKSINNFIILFDS